MAVAFTNLSWWLWSGKQQEPRISNGSSMNPSSDSSMWESDALKFPLVKGTKMSFSSRRVKRKWHSREERKIDREYDVVIVPSDGECVSGSESDDSDWSIGWLEPHGPGFRVMMMMLMTVLPCWLNAMVMAIMIWWRTRRTILSTVGYIPDSYIDESEKYMEQWLSSLRSS